MSISIALDLEIDPATGLRANASRIGEVVEPSSWLAAFDFNDGDTSSTVKNGVFFQSTQALGTPAGQTEQGLDFTYPATPPNVDPNNSEIRFTHPESLETYEFIRFWVPANFFHRECLKIQTLGDVSGWQAGDIVTGIDGISQGTIHTIIGQNVYLLFAENPLLNEVWEAGIVTNVTRSTTVTALARDPLTPGTGRSVEASNNKLFTKWCDDYSTAGQGPTIVLEFSADYTGGSQLGLQYSTGQGGNTGNHGNPQIYAQNFINYPEDCGKFMEMITHTIMSSARGVEDGVIEIYQRKDGEANFSLILAQYDADIGPAVEDVEFTQFAQGYFIGYSNSGYDEETSFYVSQFRHTTTLPEELA